MMYLKSEVLAPNFDRTTAFSFDLMAESAGPIGPFFFDVCDDEFVILIFLNFTKSKNLQYV